jgi:hypothetical protein
VSNALSRLWHRYRALPALKQELVTFGLAVAFALAILPLAIWGAGQVFLGDYLREWADPLNPDMARRGGPFALIADYLRGILAGSPGHWVVLLGPYGLLWACRLGRRLL